MEGGERVCASPIRHSGPQHTHTHLEECINVPNGRDVLWYKRFQFGIQLHDLGSVARDVVEQLLQVSTHSKMFELCRVICTGEGMEERGNG